MKDARLKILIIDDSALTRRLLTEILQSEPDFEVVGTAANANIARRKIKDLQPDVLTLDIEMPGMDGLTFLDRIMRLRPMPVVMISTLTRRGSAHAVEAMQKGAIAWVPKPHMDLANVLPESREEIVTKVRLAGQVNKTALSPFPVVEKTRPSKPLYLPQAVIAVGASVGGTEAVTRFLERMPVWSPPIVVVQHILAPLTASFAKRLDQCVELTVGVAKEGEVLEPGRVLIAPGDKHLTVANENGCLRCRILESEKVQCHRPSVDVLFESLAHSVGDLALAALMTGMGEDGARGLGQIREAGGFTVAQDQATSVIWGMPGTAVRLGNAEVVLPLSEIAESLLARLSQLGAGEQS